MAASSKRKGFSGIMKHQNMYKSQGPAWKETYRKRCMERMKSNREKFLERFRTRKEGQSSTDANSLVEDLMREEWSVLSSQDPGLPQLTHNMDNIEFDDPNADNIDQILSIFEEIQKELLAEEQRILEEFHAGLEFDEASLGAVIQNLTSDEVVCPLCQRNPLFLNKAVIFCRCGMRVNTQQDCLSLGFVRTNLREGCGIHESMCPAPPSFAVVNQIGVDSLILSCQVCDFMFIVV